MANAILVHTDASIKPVREPLETVRPNKAIETLINSPVEACFKYYGKITPCSYHPFLRTIERAFHEHRPLILSPDMFWLQILQGLGLHINLHAEELRSSLVNHSDQVTLQVRRDDFVKGSPENPWEEVFEKFSDQIRPHLGEENYSKFMLSFSTTGKVEKAAFEVALMDAMQNYFKLQIATGCGIPEVFLEGTTEDWQQVRDAAASLGKKFQLEWWMNHMIPTLEELVQCSRGDSNPEFWANIYKENNNSGGPYISGWIQNFFPYLQGCKLVVKETGVRVPKDDPNYDDKQRDAWKEEKNYVYKETPVQNHSLGKTGDFQGMTTTSLPGSISKAPVKWQYLDRNNEMQTYNMEFLSGFIGYTQEEESFALRPCIGWAVRDCSSIPTD